MPRLRQQDEEEEEEEEQPIVKAKQPKIMELEVNLSLLNNKLNYLITKIDSLYNSLTK